MATPRSSILSDVSSRVKSLRLTLRLRRGWVPEMVRLGLAQQRTSRRRKTTTRVPQLDRVRLGEWGVTARVNLHRLGMVVGDLTKHRERLESVFLARCVITKLGYGLAEVAFRHTDPLSRPVPVEALPTPDRRLHVATRIAENGTPVEQDIILPRLVIGGQGSGKSTELKTFLHGLHRTGVPFRVRVFDPKGGMELPELRAVAHRYESRPAQWGEFLGDALGALASRQRSLAARGWNKLTRFTPAEPLDILVIDELLTVVRQGSATVKADRVGTLRADDAFDQLLSQGRAAGYTVFALTQLGQKEILGNARGLFPHLTVLRMPPSEAEIVSRLVGPDCPAHLIPAGPRWAGVGYTRTPEGQVVRSRGALLTSDQWRQVVAEIAEDKARREASQRTRRENAGVS